MSRCTLAQSQNTRTCARRVLLRAAVPRDPTDATLRSWRDWALSSVCPLCEPHRQRAPQRKATRSRIDSVDACGYSGMNVATLRVARGDLRSRSEEQPVQVSEASPGIGRCERQGCGPGNESAARSRLKPPRGRRAGSRLRQGFPDPCAGAGSFQWTAGACG